MSDPRKPAAFRLEPETVRPAAPAMPASSGDDQRPRKPRAVKAEAALVIPDEIDVFDTPEALSAPPPAEPVKRRPMIGAIFAGAFGILISLAVGIWTDQLIRNLFTRADWLGWLALAAALIAALALLVIIAREGFALVRLASVEKLRNRAAEAIARNDPKSARLVVADLTSLVSSQPETAQGRRAIAELKDDVIDGRDLVRIAETEILGPLDARATVLILDAAKRVSLITAVSPRAVVDIAYVVFEAGRLIRRLAELYGSRPGTLGLFRLIRSVLAHLAVTGSIAVGDSFVQQVVGHGLAARLSAKLGEGVVNGMMTARIGLAAMETVRPLPFAAVKRPGMGHFVSALASFTGKTKDEK